MPWEIVSISLLIALIAAMTILWAVFGRRIRSAAQAKGRASGLGMADRIATGDIHKLAQALEIDELAAAVELITEAVASNKRVTQAGPERWNLRVIGPDDTVFVWNAGTLHVVRSREALGNVMGGRDWLKVVKAVEAAASERRVPTHRTTVVLNRSAEKLDNEHVWTAEAFAG